MPLHREQKIAVGASIGFDQPIRRGGFDRQALAEPSDALPVQRIDLRPRAARDLREQAARVQVDGVARGVLRIEIVVGIFAMVVAGARR